MTPLQAAERVRDGHLTLIRELGLPVARGVPAYSDVTGCYAMADAYHVRRPGFGSGQKFWKDRQCVGFLAGRLWLLSRLFKSDAYAGIAAELCRRIEPALSQGPLSSESLGFDITYALCLGYNHTGDPWFRDAALRAIGRMAQNYRPALRLFLCDADSDEVVIDTAGPFACFLWAGAFEPSYRALIKTHMDRILELGLIKPDGECFQGVQFDLTTSEVKRYYSRQGYLENSRWTRGQAWGIHNYLNGFEATGDQAHLDASLRAARWFWDRLPESMVNFYDYDDPNGPKIPLDTCSSFMAANAFIRYGRMPEIADRAEWAERGRRVVERVCTDHMTYGGVILHGSWGKNTARSGKGRWPQEDVMSYGNYWSLECLYRLLSEDWSVVSLRGAA